MLGISLLAPPKHPSLTRRPNLVLLGPLSNPHWRGFREAIEVALQDRQAKGQITLFSWNNSTHQGTIGSSVNWRTIAREADLILFLFGWQRRGTRNIAHAGTVVYRNDSFEGQRVLYDTTATEQEFLECVLRPIDHLLLIPRGLPQDKILRRIVEIERLVSTRPKFYGNAAEAARFADDFVAQGLRVIQKRRQPTDPGSDPIRGDRHYHGLWLKPRILREAPPHIQAAFVALAESFDARRNPRGGKFIANAAGFVRDAIALALQSPSQAKIEAGTFFQKLTEWAGQPLSEGLKDNAPTRFDQFFWGLSCWERCIFLLAAGEWGLVCRYRHQYSKDLQIQLAVSHLHEEGTFRKNIDDASQSALRVFEWCIALWQERFAGAASYAGHPECIEKILGGAWQRQLDGQMKRIYDWKILQEPFAKWKLRAYVMKGAAAASNRDWELARFLFDQAISLARRFVNSSQQNVVPRASLGHVLVRRLLVTEDVSQRRRVLRALNHLIKYLDSWHGDLYDSYEGGKKQNWSKAFPRTRIESG